MSRPSEIANSLLHRYYNQKQENILPTSATPRPKRIQSVTSIPAAEKFRSFVIREISTKVTRINDPSLGESQIRDLNDEINKLINEKLSWEYRIKELGGPDYIVFSKRQLSKEFSVRNYRYFGRARDLNDVKELLEIKKQKKTKTINDEKEIMKYVNDHIKNLDLLEYYGLEKLKLSTGLVINDDQIMEQVGLLAEFPYITHDEFVTRNSEYFKPNTIEEQQHSVDRAGAGSSGGQFSFDEFNPPSMEDIELMLVERRKSELKRRLGIE